MNNYSDFYVTGGTDQATLQWIKEVKAHLHRCAADSSPIAQILDLSPKEVNT